MDDVVGNWKLVGSRLIWMITGTRKKQSEVVLLDDFTDKWKLVSIRSSQIINHIEIQTE